MEEDDLLIGGLHSFQDYLQNAIRFDGRHVTDDMTVYRYMSKDRFLEMVENTQFVFPHISLWEDPFEGFLFKAGEDAEASRMTYAGFYGLSWTFGKSETDLRWRAYCPEGDGVRIKTTVGALRGLAKQLFCSDKSRVFVMTGPVIYVDDKWRMVLNDKRVDPLPLQIPNIKNRSDAAKWLFIKRGFFKQEKEFRIICHVGHTGMGEFPHCESDFERKGGLLKCTLSQGVNQFIEEIIVDPRMSLADVDRFKCRLVQSDVNLKVSQSSIYKWPNI